MLTRLSRAFLKVAHPKVGVYCSLFCAAMCGVGSLLGQYAPNFHHRHVAGFWWAPRWHSVWTFGLLVALGILLLHSAVRLQIALRGIRTSGAASRVPLLRAAGVFVTVGALAAYAWFVVAAPSEEFKVSNAEVNIHGEYYRVVRVEFQRRTDAPRPLSIAWIERRFCNATEKMRVERGKWWQSRVGKYELALARARLSADGAVFRHGNRTVTVGLDRPAPQGIFSLILRALHRHSRDPASEVRQAEVEVAGQKKVLPLDPEWAGETAFLGMKSSPVILIRVHRNLTLPLAGLAIFLLLLARIVARSAGQQGTRSLP